MRTSNRQAVFITMLMVPLLAGGCVSRDVRSHDQALDMYDQVALKDWLIPGKTTRKDVLVRLGPPADPADFSTAPVWRYTSSETTRLAVLPVPPLLLGKARSLTLHIGENNTLASYNVTEGKPELQKGDNPVGFNGNYR